MPRDTFGIYVVLTGNEGSGKCWWCGSSFPDRRVRRFCSEPCRRKYEESFYWAWASNGAIRGARYRCRDCGLKGKRRLQVHHIIPLDGSDRMKNVLNRRENLVVLCKRCHQKRHAVNNSKVKGKKLALAKHVPCRDTGAGVKTKS